MLCLQNGSSSIKLQATLGRTILQRRHKEIGLVRKNQDVNMLISSVCSYFLWWQFPGAYKRALTNFL